MNILEIKNLNFSYGKHQVLKDINLSLEDGDKLIIIGPNGCGKTTLLKVISAYLQADSGSVTLDGRDLHSYTIKDRAKIISVQHQNPNSSFDFTVEEVVEMGRYPFLSWTGKLGETDKKIVAEQINIMELTDLKDKSILETSGGEKGRTMTARAFAQSPKLILMDEPIAAMDINHQIKLMKTVEKTEDKSFIIVLHDLNLASAFADKIALMKEGQIVALGRPEEVINAENIRQVYEVQVDVIMKDDRPFIIPKYR